MSTGTAMQEDTGLSEKNADQKHGETKMGRKRRTLSQKVTISSIAHAGILGTAVLLIGMFLFMYSILYDSYRDTANMAQTVSDVLQTTADVPGLVDAVLAQEREDPHFEDRMEASNPAETEGQLLNYRWYTEEDPPLAKRDDYQQVMDIILAFGKNNTQLNGTSLMVFDKKTHIASLLCDVEKFGGDEAVPVQEILWRRFEDVELDHIEEERWSLLKNLVRYMRIDPRYVAFAWYEPFPYPDEDVVVFIEADAFYTRLWSNMISFLLVFFLLLLVAVIVMGLAYRRRMQKVIVKPIHAVAEAAKNYAADRRSGQRDKAYFSSLELHTGDEYESLAETMAEMEKEIEVFEEDLTRVTIERERLTAELDVAAQIQQNMLPQKFPLYPDRSEFEVYASMTPAKAVGGDFYDIFLIDEDHLALVMADVSGKGIPAALFMVISMTLIKNRALMGGSPAEILDDVNRQLCNGNQRKTSMFVTVWFAIVTLSTGEVAEGNAGHENPLLLQRSGTERGHYIQSKTRHDLVLGGLKKANYHENTFVMQPGDRLFIYTDGVPEATDAAGERYGMARMTEVLDQHTGDEPKAVLAAVHEDVARFVGEADQFDDLTMMLFAYQEKEAKSEDGQGRDDDLIHTKENG